MPILEICLVITGVVIFSIVNAVVVKYYFGGSKFREKSESAFQPVEKDDMGHSYY